MNPGTHYCPKCDPMHGIQYTVLHIHIYCTYTPQVRYADLGGVEDVLSDIRELIEYPLKHPEVRGGRV